MNRVLIIGGTGTVGRQVVSQLADLGAQVRVMTRDPKKANLLGGG
ncbi:MAG TPA: NmrA family NAD(P)-binding protein [Candidatus Sulfotelmatobacter sp.]|nr:NmrA family NAD(P)-binding protein [Candidatus Sulfotelmatobacter sp.]